MVRVRTLPTGRAGLAGIVLLTVAWAGQAVLTPTEAGSLPIGPPARPAVAEAGALDHDPRCLVLGAALQTLELCRP